MSAPALRLAKLIRDDPSRARTEALRLLDAESRRSKRVRVKAAATRRPTETAKQRRERMWPLIRAEVAKRVDAERQGRCEWCERRAEDPHHIIGGSGKRRIHEAANTVAGICRECHRAWEENDPDTLGRAFKWAREHGFIKAAMEIEIRIMRVVERSFAASWVATPRAILPTGKESR